MEIPRLRLLESQEPASPPPPQPPSSDEKSLVARAGQFFHPDSPISWGNPPDLMLSAPPGTFVRRSPIQPYRVPEAYRKRKRQRRLWALLALLVLFFLALSLFSNLPRL